MFIPNSKIFELASQAGATNEEGGPILTGAICFTKTEFEDFINRYNKYVQDRMKEVVKKASDENIYIGDDIPSWKLFHEHKNF